MTETYRRDDGVAPIPWKAVAVVFTAAIDLDSALADIAASRARRSRDRRLVRAEERAARRERKQEWWRNAEIGLIDGEGDE